MTFDIVPLTESRSTIEILGKTSVNMYWFLLDKHDLSNYHPHKTIRHTRLEHFTKIYL